MNARGVSRDWQRGLGSERAFVGDPPPSRRQGRHERDRCAVCRSEALLVGYCACDEPICRVCQPTHTCQRRT